MASVLALYSTEFSRQSVAFKLSSCGTVPCASAPEAAANDSPAETTALVAFLKSLHPPNQAPAQDASLVSVASPQTSAGAGKP